MEGSPRDVDVAVAPARQVVVEFIFNELDLGLAFLGVAETTADLEQARRSVRQAITALRTADRAFSTIQPGTTNVDAIRQLREQLTQRLHEISGWNESGRRYC